MPVLQPQKPGLHYIFTDINETREGITLTGCMTKSTSAIRLNDLKASAEKAWRDLSGHDNLSIISGPTQYQPRHCRSGQIP